GDRDGGLGRLGDGIAALHEPDRRGSVADCHGDRRAGGRIASGVARDRGEGMGAVGRAAGDPGDGVGSGDFTTQVGAVELELDTDDPDVVGGGAAEGQRGSVGGEGRARGGRGDAHGGRGGVRRRVGDGEGCGGGVVRGITGGDGEDVAARLQGDARDRPGGGAGGGAVAAATVGPGDLGDADVIGGGAAQGQRARVGRIAAARGRGRDGGGRRGGVGASPGRGERDQLHDPVAGGAERGGGAVGAGGGDDAILDEVAV